ncbi:unnamed protein product [Spirodela intermedia]|uniref:H15 domain-containing protein n=1 Tax=Spirodela intermedia TaxID=51605 RepID=A0A7I8IET2_SPIIN|nr:unnamed protein product [Spirodela intermedia]CAA6655904.1 unnamed protein product [Spirodela intermedia]
MAEEATVMATEMATQAEGPVEVISKLVAEKKSKPAKEKKAPLQRFPRRRSPERPSLLLLLIQPTFWYCPPPSSGMIKEAILALKEKSGSSPYAIAKHMEEKYKSALPANFRKILTLQLKNCLANGKIVKVKGSFKLSEVGKKTAVVKKVVTSGKEKKPKAPAAKVSRPKVKLDAEKKRKVSTPTKTKAGKSVKTGVKKSKKTTPLKPKQPKSIKSPAAKRARKVIAV